MKCFAGTVLLTGFLIVFTVNNSFAEFGDRPIRICEDKAGWPPYHYEVVDETTKKKTAKGYGIDVINTIFKKHNLEYSIDFLPWKRCLQLLQIGNKCHMALSGSYSAWRNKAFYLVSWYKTQKYYFYSKKHYPKGLAIMTLADLRNYRLGGIFGYSYEYLGALETSIDKGTKDYDALIKKLDRGRVDLFVEQYEVMAGFSVLGKNYLNLPDLNYARVPELEPTWFNMMISKKYEHALPLRQILSAGIAELRWSEEHMALLHKHGLQPH